MNIYDIKEELVLPYIIAGENDEFIVDENRVIAIARGEHKVIKPYVTGDLEGIYIIKNLLDQKEEGLIQYSKLLELKESGAIKPQIRGVG